MTTVILQLGAIFVVVLLVGFFFLLMLAGGAYYATSVYNRLVRVDERCDNAWSDIDVKLKQRQDMLGKLIDTAQQAMDYEQETFQMLVEAREKAQNANSPQEHAEADNMVKEALSGMNISARAEAYPDLGAVDNLQDLQNEIATIEEEISDRREVYNEAVTSYNTIIRQFPYVLMASPLGYQKRELFEVPESETADVDVGDMFDESGDEVETDTASS